MTIFEIQEGPRRFTTLLAAGWQHHIYQPGSREPRPRLNHTKHQMFINRKQVQPLWINYRFKQIPLPRHEHLWHSHCAGQKPLGVSAGLGSTSVSPHAIQSSRLGPTVTNSDAWECLLLPIPLHFLFLISRRTCHQQSGLSQFSFEPLCFFSHTCSKVYQRKHLPSQGWLPCCDRLIQLDWTSFRQRTLIIMKALRTQCELTSHRLFPANSALS